MQAAALSRPAVGPGTAAAKLISRRRSAVREAAADREPMPNAALPASAPDEELPDELAQSLLQGVPEVALKQLGDPGPDRAQLDRLLHAAAAVPGRAAARPWRLVLVPAHKRAQLAEAFAAARLEREPAARPLDLALARQQAFRAPLLMLAVARLAPEGSSVPSLQRAVSLGCALGNMLLAAHGMGFGSGLSGGPVMVAPALRALFRLGPSEQAACFLHVGTVRANRPGRIRPRMEDFLSEL
jgi:nitroreductase